MPDRYAKLEACARHVQRQYGLAKRGDTILSRCIREMREVLDTPHDEPGWLARTPAGTHQPACDFDPLAVSADWDDSTDIATKVAAAAMAYARRTPDAVGEARDANADAVSILRRGCAEIDGLPLDKQSPCPEDMALWALTYITRLLAAEAEREAGR